MYCLTVPNKYEFKECWKVTKIEDVFIIYKVMYIFRSLQFYLHIYPRIYMLGNTHIHTCVSGAKPLYVCLHSSVIRKLLAYITEKRNLLRYSMNSLICNSSWGIKNTIVFLIEYYHNCNILTLFILAMYKYVQDYSYDHKISFLITSQFPLNILCCTPD